MTECVDRWNPGTCSLAAMQAYKLLELEGQIVIDQVEVGRKTERVIVHYQATGTHEDALGRLRAAKAQLEGAVS